MRTGHEGRREKQWKGKEWALWHRLRAPWLAHVPALDCACASEQEKLIKNAQPGPVNHVETCCCAASSELQLSSELEVWEALSLWVNYSLPDRKGDVAKLLGSCLRLQDMDVLQLQQLRQTPLVRGQSIGHTEGLHRHGCSLQAA